MATATVAAGPQSQSLRARAVIAAALLAGFYVLSLGILALIVAANYLFVALTNRVYPYLIVASGAAILTILRGLILVERRSKEDPGLVVDGASQPALTALISEVAAAMQAKVPDTIGLRPGVNASVQQADHLLGLIPGKRRLNVGVGLLHGLTVGEIRAVLAHEFGHFQGGDTRLGGFLYRCGAAVQRTTRSLGGSAFGGIFNWYAGHYFTITQRIRRQQEFAADAVAAQMVSPRTVAAMLDRVDLSDVAWSTLVREYLIPAWEQGVHPVDVYGGMDALASDAVRHAEFLQALGPESERQSQVFDSHPTMAERKAYLATLQAGEPSAQDGAPARVLLSNAAATEADLGWRVAAGAAPGLALTPIHWADYPAAVIQPEWRAAGSRLAAAIEAEQPGVVPTLATALGLIAGGHREGLMAVLIPGYLSQSKARRESLTNAVLSSLLAAAIGLALVQQRGCRVELSWSKRSRIVNASGASLDLSALGLSLLSAPNAAAAAEHLAGLGLNLNYPLTTAPAATFTTS